DSDRSSVRETVPVRARLSADLGEAADQTLPAVSLYFNMTEAQQAELTQLLQDQQSPASPHYHQWLTPQQFGARFGLTDADLQKVETWLTSRGLKVIDVPPSRNYVTFSGNLRQIEGAFSTSIHSVSFQGQRHFSNLSDPQLPTPIAGLVTAITGLNDFKPRAHSIAKAHFTSGTTGAHFIAPGDFYTIYDVNPLLTQSIKGDGMTIAVVGQTDISLTDVAAFRSAAGLPAKAPQITPATGYVAGTTSGDIDEAHLDVEWAGAIAPNATVNFVTVGASTSASVVDALKFAIANNAAPIISMSYGNCEDAWGQSNINAITLMLQQANAQGITFVSSSGDSGATDCDVAPPADYGLTVDFPSSSPFALSAGGTMFNEGSATGGSSYWSAASGSDNVSSAKGYIPEAVWNESSSSGLSSGGGGVSSYFAKPSWQQGLTPADSSRDVPDISLNAASNHDGYLFCSQGSCVNGFRTSSGTLNVVGGTSAVSPALAGIFALLEQKLGGGTAARLGNVNPVIYALAGSQYYGNVFHDVTSGNNNSTCQVGTTNCPSGGSIGYNAGTGYDLATGWGSLDVAELVSKWGLVSPAGTSTSTGANLSSTTIQLANSASTACSTSGSLNITITVAKIGSSTNLSTPTGSVQMLVDGVAPSDGGIVPLTNGTANYTVPGQSRSGEHTISAIYLGDGVYNSSKGVLVADFVSSSNPDFALTPCTTSISVASGATTSGIPFTVTSANSFSGPVSFSISSDSSIAASFSFSATSVNVAAGSSAQTTLVITAAQNTTTASAKTERSVPLHWYAGSAVSFTGMLFLFAPRRRRFTPLVALVLSIGAISISGCGGGGGINSGSTTGGSGTSGGSTTTNAKPGTYNLNVTATGSTGVVHTSTVTLKVN
ncbi:MAG TPA: protease pro-enzyme activation domain-containing protein, partial [Edaphobacter sp.]|nr:protease pro-enzyme activation domain-containing protein [Edaphobacter sp.]